MTAALAFATLLIAAPAAREPAAQPPLEVDVDIVERLNEPVPAGLTFASASGQPITLGELRRGRPTLVALVYYRCPVLCGLLLGGLAKSLSGLGWHLGREYDVVTVSLDPSEPVSLAAEKRRGFLQALGVADGPWHFLTGQAPAIDALAEALGFQFRYDGTTRQFAHVAALAVLTPDGRVSRYLYGVEFEPLKLKLAVFEAAGGRVGTSFERVLLRCWKWSPAQKHYELFVMRYFRVGGVLIVCGVGGLLLALWRRELRRTPP